MMKFLLLIILATHLVFGQVQVNREHVDLEKVKHSNSFTWSSSNNDIHFELGIQYELILILANEFNNKDRKFENTVKPLPYNFHLTAGVGFLRHYKIDFRYGIIAAFDYIFGIDRGLYFQADLPDSKYYGIIGVDFFNNNLAGDGNTWTGGKFTFYCIGLGYLSSKNLSIDILYSFPSGNKVYAKDQAFDYGGPPGEFYDKKINGLIRLGFQYSFIF